MQKISPLRAGLDAFNRFKAQRLQKSNEAKAENTNSTNPFGISFKGNVLQMDVFDSSTKKSSGATNPIQDGLEKVNKFVASARVATMNKIESIKQGAISFGSKIKENVVNTYNKLATTEVNFDFLKNTPSRLQKRPVSELEEMFKAELGNMEV